MTPRAGGAAILAVLAPIVDDIGQRVSHLPRARQILGVVAIREHSPHAAELRVHALCRGDLERAHAIGECLRVLRLDDEVNVIALHRELHDAAVIALRRQRDRGPAQRAPQIAAPEYAITASTRNVMCTGVVAASAGRFA